MVQWHGGRPGDSSGTGDTLPLPDGTQLGDLLVCADWRNAFADPRLTKIGGEVNDGIWVGYATTMDPLVVSASGTDGVHICASFAPQSVMRSEESTGTTSTVTPPSVENGGTILVSTFRGNTIGGTGGFDLPPVYTEGIRATIAIAGIRIDYWNGTPPSPAGAYANFITPGGDPSWRATVIIPGGLLAPPARLHPRADHLGVGSGRTWPPAGTRQSGRLNGPY